MPDDRQDIPDDRLNYDALLYAGNELDRDAAELFEERLATDQAARDALANAMQLTLLVAGRPTKPDPQYREEVRSRFSHPSWWGRFWKPRIRRGPALAWVAVGGIAASVAIACWPIQPLPSPVTEPVVIEVVERLPEPTIEAVVPIAVPTEQVADATPIPTPMGDMTSDAAAMWEEMSNSDHLQRVQEEELRRRAARDRVRRPDTNTGAGRVLGSTRGER